MSTPALYKLNPNRAFYRASEVAEIIGLGESITYRLIARGEIASIYLAGLRSRRVPASALQEWIDRQTEQTAE